jgi:predicted membrane channel-forming protein YqfA (hemolysin III family)
MANLFDMILNIIKLILAVGLFTLAVIIILLFLIPVFTLFIVGILSLLLSVALYSLIIWKSKPIRDFKKSVDYIMLLD